MMTKVPRKILKTYFLETIRQFYKSNDSNDNPFIIENIKSGSKTNIFLKNISSAYFRNSSNITRIQVARTPGFEKIRMNGEICVPIGYDSDNDVFIVWNPWTFILRINERENISIYSRLSVQKRCASLNMVDFRLSNDEIVYGVNPKYLANFIIDLESFFINAENKLKNEKFELTIIDKMILVKIHSLLRERQILFAVECLMTYYEKMNLKIGINEAFHVINLEYKKLHSR